MLALRIVRFFATLTTHACIKQFHFYLTVTRIDRLRQVPVAKTSFASVLIKTNLYAFAIILHQKQVLLRNDGDSSGSLNQYW